MELVPVRKSDLDPVFVGRRPEGHKIELRIGESRRGESRYAMLDARGRRSRSRWRC
jgi:hypothetical protein